MTVSLLGIELAYWQESILRALGVLVAVILPAGGFVYVFLFKMMSFMQSRLGPMEAGPYGSIQLLAEVGKFLQKEDVVPDRAAQSISHETTFDRDLRVRDDCLGVLLELSEGVGRRLRGPGGGRRGLRQSRRRRRSTPRIARARCRRGHIRCRQRSVQHGVPDRGVCRVGGGTRHGFPDAQAESPAQ